MGPYPVPKQALTPSIPFDDDMEGTCPRNKQYNSIGKRFGQYKRKNRKKTKSKLEGKKFQTRTKRGPS